MRKLALCLAMAAMAPALLAQNCFDRDIGTSLGSGQDIVFPMTSIGFAFPIGANTYTDIHVTDHGHVFLSNANVPPAPASGDAALWTPSTANLVAGSPKVCALWSDIIAPIGEVFVFSSPAKCVVTWQNVHTFGNATSLFDMQLTLFPNGDVRFFYGPGATNDSTWGGVSDNGIVGVSPGGGASIPPSSDLSTGPVTTNDTTYELFATAQTFDMADSALLLAATAPGYATVPLGPPSQCASAFNYGEGCLDLPGSVYEEFTAGSGFDLDNTSIAWIRTGNGYQMIPNFPGVFVPPSGTATNVAPGALDGQQSFTLSAPMPAINGATTTVNVTTKGQIELSGPTTFIDFSPSGAEFANWPNAMFCLWHDYQQNVTGSGLILYEEVGGVAYVTWNGVYDYQTTNPNTFQFQLDIASGNVTLVIGTTSLATSAFATVVGYAAPGAPVDPGSIDLSATGAAPCRDSDAAAMAQTNVGMPFIGNLGFGFQVDNIPLLVPAGFIFFGDTAINPGIDLGFIGMAGCNAFTNANIGSYSFPAPGGSGFAALPLPFNTSFVGATLTAQTLALSLDTQLNLIASNGTSFTVGY